MKKLILVMVLALVVSVAIAGPITSKNVVVYKDNDGIKLLAGTADTGAWFSFDDTKYLVTFHAASCYHADSVAKCSLFIDLRFGSDTLIQTVTGTTTAAEYTVYKKLIVPDTMAASSFRIRLKTNSAGDSMKVWSGFQAIPIFNLP